MENIITLQQTEELGAQLRRQKKSIVLVGGCFDILHFGHITLLEKAKEQGDILVVLLESDTRIQEFKGADRPLHIQSQRAHMLTALKSVDYVILLPHTMSNHDYDQVVKLLQPAIIATTKGSDSLLYIEKQAKAYNAEIFLVQPIKNISTSRLVAVIAKEV